MHVTPTAAWRLAQRLRCCRQGRGRHAELTADRSHAHRQRAQPARRITALFARGQADGRRVQPQPWPERRQWGPPVGFVSAAGRLQPWQPHLRLWVCILSLRQCGMPHTWADHERLVGQPCSHSICAGWLAKLCSHAYASPAHTHEAARRWQLGRKTAPPARGSQAASPCVLQAAPLRVGWLRVSGCSARGRWCVRQPARSCLHDGH